MSVWHLTWIIPACLVLGFLAAAILAAGKILAAEEVLRERTWDEEKALWETEGIHWEADHEAKMDSGSHPAAGSGGCSDPCVGDKLE